MIAFFKKYFFVKSVLLLIVGSLFLFGLGNVVIAIKYNKAEKLYTSNDLENAKKYFDELGYYKDSQNYREKIEKTLREDNLDKKSGLWVEGNDAITNNNDGLTQNDKIETISIKEIRNVNLSYNLSASDIVLTENTLFIDSNDKERSTSDLIGDRICLFFKGTMGNYCFFLGQFNNSLHWEGECTICSYKEGKLLYITEDLYEDGILKEYKRFSIKNDKWIFSKKLVQNGAGYFGDTYSYAYKDVIAKEYDITLPKEEYLYTIDELKNELMDNLISHYYGEYSADQNWYDLSGSAYRLKFDNGNVTEIFKGTFINNGYGSGQLIQISDDKVIKYSIGMFRDESGAKVTVTPIPQEIDYKELMILIQDQPYMEEATIGLEYLR